MKETEPRGSSKLLSQLLGVKATASEATMAKALGVASDKIKIEGWWVRGQPRPDVFWAKLRVPPELVGDLAGRLIKGGLVVEGFPLGKPGVLDAAMLNVSNLPAQLR